MLDTTEVREYLEKKQAEYNAVSVEEALTSSVETERFYRHIASVSEIHTDNERVDVRFAEPVPGSTTLDDGYIYTVSVSRDELEVHRNRCEMPREDLLVLQQVAITVWAMVTGEIY